MSRIEDLTVGTRVRVTSRGGATGTVDAPHTMDNTVIQPRPVVHIRFDGKRASFGLNYPEDVEIIGERA
jgi:hypothetical protein